MIEDLRFKNRKSKIVNPNFTPDIFKITGKTSMSHPYPQHKKPELLSPAGDMECFFAAVENGADAVYFGLKDFIARSTSDNFYFFFVLVVFNQGINGNVDLDGSFAGVSNGLAGVIYGKIVCACTGAELF